MRRGAPLKRGKPKRSQPRRYWDDALAKAQGEGRCRFFRLGGCEGKIECAHVMGREHDRPGELVFIPEAIGKYDLYVDPRRIFPACKAHHGAYDRHELDALPVLTVEEQVLAVEDAGGIALALRRISGRDYDRRAA